MPARSPRMSKIPKSVMKVKLAPFASERASGKKREIRSLPFTLKETRSSASAARKSLQICLVACVGDVEVIGRI